MKRILAVVALIALATKAPIVAGILAGLLVVINLIVEEADRNRRVTVDLLAPRRDPALPSLHHWRTDEDGGDR